VLFRFFFFFFFFLRYVGGFDIQGPQLMVLLESVMPQSFTM